MPASDEDDNDDSSDNSPVGADLELQVANLPAEAWAVIQWQDSASGCHDVEGRQGPIGTNNYQQ